MHYVPPSFQSLAEPPVEGNTGESRAEADLAVAPSLLLALLVALLLGADYVLTLVDLPAWLAWRSVFGFRLAFWAAILGGAKILYRTLEGLFEGRVGADLALTIACGAALLLGEPAVAAWVVLIALGGEALENMVASRARSAIGGLFDLRPRIVHRVRDGQDEDVPLEQIAPGDTVVVRPGERIPVDGVVLIGRSAVDQSSLTGESWPVDREEGDAVYTGTLNQFGALTISVQRVGNETTYGQILRLVAEAAQRKCGLERTADRLARYFLPAVLLAAGATLIGWRIAAGNWQAGWMPALAVLVVACPCPLILATPSAVLAALARLARMGVLIKGSAALERLAGVDQFAFDKTGTLTAGRPELGTLVSLGNFTPRDLLRVAAAAERHSEHLLGRLLVAAAHAENAVIPQIGEFEAQPGAGVTARVRVAALPPDWMTILGLPVDRGADCRVIVGNRRLLEANGVSLDEHAQTKLAELDASGQTPLLVAIERRIIGLIGVRDAVRSEARDVLSELRSAGIRRCALLTGDRAAPARRVVETLGFVGPICAEMSPLDKAHWIEEQTRAGSRVAMVGDGVNDAPALAAADVGLALGGVGSQLAAEAGDIVLMGDPLAPLPGLLRLSREFVRIIRQGVFLFAFGVNGIGVILSAWGVLNPIAAALFHEAASILVMLNALRLLWFENWQTTHTGRTLAAAGELTLQWASRLSPARWGTWLLVEWKLVLRLAAAAAGIVWCLSNLVLIRDDEQALVTRCGRYHTTLTAGLHLRWPAPFEELRREQVARVRIVPIGFRTEPALAKTANRKASTRAIEWSAEHNESGFHAVPAESLVLAADEVVVEVAAELQYRISDLRQFAYTSADVPSLLLAASEQALRQASAQRQLDDILTGGRPQIEVEVVKHLQATADRYRLGVEVLEFDLLDIHPPLPVVSAYRDVADAMEQREQLVNEARTTYIREVLTAAGETALERLEKAPLRQPPVRPPDEQPAPPPTNDIDAAWNELTADTPGTPTLSGTAAARLAQARQIRERSVQQATGEASRFAALAAEHRNHPAGTVLEVYWRAVEAALGSTRLMIVDPQAAGRQHLFLGNSQGEPPPLPVMMAPPREDSASDRALDKNEESSQ